MQAKPGAERIRGRAGCWRLVLTWGVLAVLAGWGVSCTKLPERTWYTKSRTLYYGIPVQVRFSPKDPELAKRIWRYLESVDTVFNDYRDDSEVGRLNAAGKAGEYALSPDLAAGFALALSLYKETDGAFDVSVGPLRRLWRQAAKKGQAPDAEAIQAALGRCGLNHVRLEKQKLIVDCDGMQFDFGGVVKGMAVDRVMAMIHRSGARAALVQVGGETAAFGLSPRNKPYVIGIQHPLDLSALWTAIRDPGTGLGCATSGNYRNPIQIGAQTYYHIFDPRTGRPIDTHVLSVTICFSQTGKNGLADGLSTAGAVLGADRILSIVRHLGGEVLFLQKKGQRIVERQSPGWQKLKEPQ